MRTADVAPFVFSPAMWLVLDAIAVFRLSRLVAVDTVLARPRDYVRKRWPKLFLFLTCPWCVSVWIAAAVVALTVYFPTEWRFVAYVLTCSAVAGLLSERR